MSGQHLLGFRHYRRVKVESGFCLHDFIGLGFGVHGPEFISNTSFSPAQVDRKVVMISRKFVNNHSAGTVFS